MIDTFNEFTDGQAPVALAVFVLLATYLLAGAIRRSRGLRESAPWGPRIGKYLGVAALGWLLTGATLTIVWCLVLRTGQGTFADAANDMGLHWRLPAPEVVLWSVGMILASMVASYAIAALRRYFGGGPTAAGLDILPETPAETVMFSLVVAPTGGIGEEIVYRGFLLGQLWGITDNAWIAAFVSSAVFGGLHLYQGWWGVARTGLIGFILAVGLIMTGSLIPSIIAHTLANMLGAAIRKPMAPQPAAS